MKVVIENTLNVNNKRLVLLLFMVVLTIQLKAQKSVVDFTGHIKVKKGYPIMLSLEYDENQKPIITYIPPIPSDEGLGYSGTTVEILESQDFAIQSESVRIYLKWINPLEYSLLYSYREVEDELDEPSTGFLSNYLSLLNLYTGASEDIGVPEEIKSIMPEQENKNNDKDIKLSITAGAYDFKDPMLKTWQQLAQLRAREGQLIEKPILSLLEIVSSLDAYAGNDFDRSVFNISKVLLGIDDPDTVAAICKKQSGVLELLDGEKQRIQEKRDKLDNYPFQTINKPEGADFAVITQGIVTDFLIKFDELMEVRKKRIAEVNEAITALTNSISKKSDIMEM